MGLIAQDIADHMRRVGTWVDWGSTCDTFKSGDPRTAVRVVAVSWMSTLQALDEAHRRGCNVFITHEPTFHAHMDDDPAFDRDGCVRRKRQWLAETGMVVYRCHDVWDRYPADGVLDRWTRCLGLSGTPVAERPYMRVIPTDPQPAETLARAVAGRVAAYGQPAVQLIGEASQTVTRVGVGTGAITDVRAYHDMGADVGIVTEVCYWRDVRWAQDTGLPLIVVDHTVSEEPGMEGLAEFLSRCFPDVRVEYIPTGCPFQLVPADAKGGVH